MKRIKKIIELSRWFNRKSQHYILGNWACYVEFSKKIDYYKRYPLAYIKFMWLSRDEL